jgi:hypothetical protein
MIKIIAVLLSTLAAGQALAVEGTIQNGVFWKDTAGNPIYSQGGGMLKVGDTWYWYGAKYAESVSYAAAPGPTPAATGPVFRAVTAYSSRDLVHWTFEGDVIQAGASGKMFE